MARSIFATLLIMTTLSIPSPSRCQEPDSATIEGRVYDMYEAVIPKVTILLEDVGTHTVTNLKTDDQGYYRISVRPGRYLLSQKPIVGFPIPYEHSSFSISRGERVVINFRPRFPRAISDSIQGGHWIERYEPGGAHVSTTVHFIEQSKPGPFIRDLRVQSVETRLRDDVIEYRTSVTASFDRFTVYADRVQFYPKRGKLLAEQDLLFEDGNTARRGKKLELDLNTGSALLDGARLSATLN